MNPRLCAQNSSISGKGIVTQTAIQKGETVFVLSGERCTFEQIVAKVEEGSEEPSDPLGIGEEVYLDLEEFSRTFNHSCEPNTYVRGESELVALRDIMPGEEITYDYSTTMHDNVEKWKSRGCPVWSAACNCRSASCRKIIDQFVRLPKKSRNFYIDHSYLPDYMLNIFQRKRHREHVLF